ncbi:LOW QUALITY PROTEIN: taste receptor type 2 member 3 [Pteronotus mesoamericanus]|uniref:LOW QUALITY PROTEIN: taste receptor type 2 member 3 n=1 Tax=Pteronotus mesoamericanus TaxID=1884717 RepID=UPI0023EB9235|nr:LOW QUALITY PROTEIN: taste receptor type 2 member 3 [Pteronotus parnellii mesoamericanus]
MLVLSKWVTLFLSVAQFILGMLGNGFIGLVNGSSWFKSKRISLSDFIITTLALCRIVLLWILFTDGLIAVFFSHVYDDSELTVQVIDIFWTFTNHLSIWLATSLGVLYCLKIASFSHPTFLWLKWRVSRVVAWMLLGALVLSCGSAISLIPQLKIYFLLHKNPGTSNVTEQFKKQMHEYQMIHVLGMLWYLPPLIVSLASYVLLILSLGRHMKQMQQNRTSPSDASTEAHKRAIRIVFSFLFLFLFYCFSFTITSSSYFLPRTEMIKMIGEMVTMLYPAGHSFILILGNNKLKQTFVELLWCESGHWKPGPKGPLAA